MPPVFRFAPSPTAICISAMRCRRCSTSTWRARPAGGCCCASRTSTRRAAGRNTRRRSTRTSPGSALPGNSRCGGSPSISTITARRSPSSTRWGLIFPSFESRAEIAALVAARGARRLAARSRRRAALSGRREVDAGGRAQAAHRARRALRPAPRHGGGDGADRAAALGRRPARGLPAKPARSPPIPPPGATSSWPQGDADQLSPRRRGRRRAQGVTHVVRGQDLFQATSVHRLLQALLGLAGAALSPPPADPRRRRQQAVQIDAATGLRELRAQGVTPADIRRLVGLD